ncbi:MULTISPECIES: hypothetical protein [Aeromonas]|uniref:hypothetical protein n=1 Tax=Aeromonas TaxID=642 RepID=UPI0015EB7AF0|nr:MULTISPECIES: hypothetical protein [Aeromonas]MBA2799152.1 hypothetical protein [Aeromonas veronii]MBL0489669.1 hypothetical protein [Aeromonas veronii]QXB98536.1 hypothetical protein I6L48_16135 [Aeromonas sp. FDAARGOS 1418]UBR47136.1 hypothetical protein LAG74_08540 [Aeromonas veronii]
MPYQVMRRDLTDTTRKCDFCPQYLSSLKAYVLKDLETGKLFYAGPTCAKNKAGEGSTVGVPDLTKFTLSANDRECSGSGGQGGTSEVNPEKNAIEYLLLRELKLVSELNCSYSVLKNYYEKYCSTELSEADVRHVNNIAARAPDNLSPHSLQRTYNCLFWIDVAIEKLPPEKTDFLKGVRKTILSKGKVYDKQISSINKWFKNINGVPQLK